MDRRTIDDLLALIDAGSVSAAATRRNVTQPAFSRRLRAIETELGFAVADRARKPVGPSAALLRFEPDLRGLAVGMVQLRRRLVDVGEGARMLRIGAVHAVGAGALPRALARIGDALPYARIRMRSSNRDVCFSLLMTGQIDIMLAHDSPLRPLPIDPAITEIMTLRDDPLTPVVGAAHAPEMRARIAAAETIPVIASPDGSFLGDVQRDGVFGQRIGRFRPRVISTMTPGVVAMAQAGLGVAWTPQSFAADGIADGRLADLSDVLPTESVSMVMLRARGAQSAFAQAGWKALGPALGDQPPARTP